jgi:hypothetical protein
MRGACAAASGRTASTAMRFRSSVLTVLMFAATDAPLSAQEGRDMKLEDAGFVMRSADTADKLQRLRRLPPRVFVSRRKGEQRYYLYADPDYCRCVFVGNAAAMQAFKDMAAKGRTLVPPVPNLPAIGVSPENQIVRDMDDDLNSDIQEGDILDYNSL